MSLALRGVALTGAACAFFVLPWLGARASVGVLAGAGLGAANLWLISKIVRALVGSSSPGSAAGWPLVAVPKLCLLAGAVWLVLRGGFVSALPFVVGVGAVPLGIVAAQLFSTSEVPAVGAADDA